MHQDCEALLDTSRQPSIFGAALEDSEVQQYLSEQPWQDVLPIVPGFSLAREEDPKIEIIEGDNLPCLNALQRLIPGKVDVIYIDPPYNTGALHFAYKDKFAASLSESHAEWVQFMRQRLNVSRELLADDGVIFIAIDDNEQARLRLLCDEIFGEQNFICQFVWHKTKKGKALSRVARQVTEYVVCFAKNKRLLSKQGLFGSQPGADVANPFHHRPNKPRLVTFPPNVISTTMEDGIYKAGTYGDPDDSLSVNVRQPFEIENGVIVTELIVYGRFRWTQRNLDLELEKGDADFHIRKGKFRIVFFKSNGHKAPSSLLDSNSGVGTYEEASKELERILGSISFVYPKPTSLVKFLIKSVTKDRPYALVLDFFAGSGVTGQSVAELNSELGGFRSCILITDNSGKEGKRFVSEAGDSGICRSITRTRISNILTGQWALESKLPLPGSLIYRTLSTDINGSSCDEQRSAV